MANQKDITSVLQDKQEDNEAGPFSVRLRAATAKKGWKQADLSRFSGVDRKRVSEYWRGNQMPARDNLLALSSALDVAPRWLAGGINATAAQLLEDLDALVAAGDDRAVDMRRTELQQLALDPDLADGLRNRANFLLGVMGDRDGAERRQASIESINDARASARQAIEQALDQSGADLGEGIRQAIISLCGQLLMIRPENASLEMIAWPVETLARAIDERLTNMAGITQTGLVEKVLLQDKKGRFRGEPE